MDSKEVLQQYTPDLIEKIYYPPFLGKKISVEVDFEDGYDELRDKYLEKIRAFVGENLA